MLFTSKFGNSNELPYYLSGVNKLALIDKADILSVSGTTDISAITLEASASFQEIEFVKDSVNYTQELTQNTSNRYVTQTINFRVMSKENSKADILVAAKELVALVRENDGSWLLFGITNGLSTSTMTKNGSEDDANFNITLTGKNKGYAANVTMSEAAIDAILA